MPYSIKSNSIVAFALLIMIAGLLTVINSNRAVPVQKWDEKDLLSQARAISKEYSVDFSLGSEEIGYINQIQYLQMHGAYLPPESPLNNNVDVFVYRVFGKWENIATYGDTSTASNEVFELALNSETGAILLTTSYQEASQVPSLKEASRKQIHIPAPFPTDVPED